MVCPFCHGEVFVEQRRSGPRRTPIPCYRCPRCRRVLTRSQLERRS